MIDNEQKLQEDEIAIVKEVGEKGVLVQMKRKGACRSCSLNMLCMGGSDKAEFRLQSDLSLKPGDIVRLHISPESRLISSFLIFIFPIFMMICFFLLSRYLIGTGERLAIVISLFGLLLSGIIINLFDRLSSNKISVEIVEKVEL
jgi:positive regulator of sigma E activity